MAWPMWECSIASAGLSAPAYRAAAASATEKKEIRNDFIETSPQVGWSRHCGVDTACADRAAAGQAGATETLLRSGREPRTRRRCFEGGGRDRRSQDSGKRPERRMRAERRSSRAATIQKTTASSDYLRNMPCTRRKKIRASNRDSGFACDDVSRSNLQDPLQD